MGREPNPFLAPGWKYRISECAAVVLNSTPVEFAFRKLNSYTRVSAGELNTLPLPPVSNKTTLDEIGELVHAFMETGGVDASPSRVQDAMATEIKLDNIIGRL